MSNMQASRDVFFMDSDLLRPRWAVEKEKVDKKFQNFSFYASSGKITSVAGTLYTSYGNSYYAKITVPENYPYGMPIASLPNHTFEPHCPHKLIDKNLCLMKSEQWSTTYSIAFVITKIAIWLNKYDYWKRTGNWPGRAQAH